MADLIVLPVFLVSLLFGRWVIRLVGRLLERGFDEDPEGGPDDD